MAECVERAECIQMLVRQGLRESCGATELANAAEAAVATKGGVEDVARMLEKAA